MKNKTMLLGVLMLACFFAGNLNVLSAQNSSWKNGTVKLKKDKVEFVNIAKKMVDSPKTLSKEFGRKGNEFEFVRKFEYKGVPFYAIVCRYDTVGVSSEFADFIPYTEPQKTELVTTESPAVIGTTVEEPVKSVKKSLPDKSDKVKIYKESVNKANCIFVISKKEYRLYVYENKELVAQFPVCYGKNPAPKTRTGDMATPECGENNPFYITQIQDASTWRHDFHDGRGNILAYGHWFMRLKLNGALAGNRSIGIHGSTNNAESVPGRGSEGCIRLRDADIKILHDKYAQIGTKVIIKGINADKYDWEKEAEKKLGKEYQ